MNPVFASKFPDRNPNANRVVVATSSRDNYSGSEQTSVDPQTAVIPAMASTRDEQPSAFDKIGAWLHRNPEKPAQPTAQAAATPAPSPEPETKTASVRSHASKPKHVAQAAKPQTPAKTSSEKKEIREAEQKATLGATPILSAGGFSSFH
jgi:hypothetical protein